MLLQKSFELGSSVSLVGWSCSFAYRNLKGNRGHGTATIYWLVDYAFVKPCTHSSSLMHPPFCEYHNLCVLWPVLSLVWNVTHCYLAELLKSLYYFSNSLIYCWSYGWSSSLETLLAALASSFFRRCRDVHQCSNCWWFGILPSEYDDGKGRVRVQGKFKAIEPIPLPSLYSTGSQLRAKIGLERATIVLLYCSQWNATYFYFWQPWTYLHIFIFLNISLTQERIGNSLQFTFLLPKCLIKWSKICTRTKVITIEQLYRHSKWKMS